MNICGGIGCKQPATKKCGKCQFGYCSKICQKNDWSRHKLICLNYVVYPDPNFCPSSSQKKIINHGNQTFYSGQLVFQESDRYENKSNVPAWKPIWDQASKAYIDGYYHDASKLFCECYRLAKIVHGEEHVSLVQILRNMGASYQRIERFEDAEIQYIQGIKIAENLMWRGNSSASEVLVQILEGIASLYNILNRTEEAEPICLRCLQVSEETFGKNNPKIINALRRLSGLREKQGRMEDALLHLVRGYDLIINSVGILDYQAVQVNIDIVDLYIRLNRKNDAEAQAKMFYDKLKAANIKPRSVAEVSVSDAACSLGNIYKSQRLFAKGQVLFDEALQIRLAHCGRDHITVAQALDGLAFCRQKQGLLDEDTEMMLLEVLRIYRGIDGPDGTNVAASLYFLSTLYGDRCEYAKAINCHQKALEMKIRLCGPIHVDVAACNSNIGQAYRRQSKFTEAKDYLIKALEILIEIHGPDHDAVMKVLGDIEVCTVALARQQREREREQQQVVGDDGGTVASKESLPLPPMLD